MREADWTLHSLTERAMASERRAAVTRRWLGWSAGACFVLGCPFSCLRSALIQWNGHGFDPTIVSLSFVGAALLLGEAHRRWRKKDEGLLRAEQDTLADDYAAMDGWVVDLRIHQGRAVSGKDRGVVWFEEGRLYFSGERTSFGLTSAQAHAPIWNDGLRNVREPSLRLPLMLDTRAGAVSLGLNLMSTPGTGWRNRPLRALDETLHEWQKSPSEVAEGQWPPLTPGPGVPTPRVLLGRALLVSAAWLALGIVFAGLAFALGASPMWLAVLPALALIDRLVAPGVKQWVVTRLPHRFWQAWRDRRCLEVRR